MIGQRVRWAGNPNPWCSPGVEGTVLAIAAKDEKQIKVLWDDRPKWLSEYTWERRKI